MGPRYKLRKYMALIPNYIQKNKNGMIKPNLETINLILDVKLRSGKMLVTYLVQWTGLLEYDCHGFLMQSKHPNMLLCENREKGLNFEKVLWKLVF